MEKEYNSQMANTGENVSPASNTLEGLPTYEQHLREMPSTTPLTSEQNHESGEQQESLAELRDRFVNENYGKYGDILETPAPISSTGAIQGRYLKVREDIDELDRCSRVDLSKAENLSKMQKLAQKTKGFISRTKEIEDKITNGEWNPGQIAEKYGDRVEKYGVSLADINRILSESWSVDDPSLISNGAVFISRENESQPYEYFCENISDVVDKHFSENVSEEQKEMMGSVIRKYIKHKDAESRYIESLEEVDSINKVEKPSEIDFSEEEVDFLAKEYADANKAAGNTMKNIYLNDMGGGSTTNDKLLDGIMYGLYGGPNSISANSIHDSKIGKKMREYMQ